ncbi:hypothetical protein [Nocardioides terrigena]|uniref:hypothetical protein n=1 Tax=Nocardioides terrigena TaxID=424797 RepID=UPI00131F1212|nr:hypothetical protein [Nocardioides terrigena]
MSATVKSDVRSPTREEAARRVRTGWVSSLVELGVASSLWVLTLSLVDVRAMTDLGLVSVLPWTAWAALAVVALSFARALGRSTSPGWLLTGYPLVLSLLVFCTPPILYGTPRYSWAWKHAGIVDFIDRTGAVDPQVDVLAVYHSWPGFFAANAMLSDLAGFDTSLSYAAWAEPILNLLALSAVLSLIRAFTTDARTIAVGGWLFVLGNWVGQGYFSPQGINFVWYLTVMTVLLRWFPGRPAPSTPDPGAARRVGLCAVVLLLLVSIVSTHQLTPVITLLVLTALVVLRQTSLRVLPSFLGVVLGAWVLYVAEPFTRTELREALSEVGTVGSNLESTLIGYGTATAGQILVSLATRVFTVGFCLMAALGVLTAWRSGRRDHAALVLAVVPFVTVGVSTYGNEVLFRAYLFAMPGLAFFAAVLLWPPGTPAVRRRAALVGVVTVPLMVGSGLAQFGNDRQYHFTPEEVAAAEFVYDNAPPGSLLIEGSRNYPSQFRNYERFTYVPIAREDPEDIQRILDDPVQAMSRWMSDTDTYSASYLIITRSQIVATTALGEIPGDGLIGIEAALRSSPEFRVVFENRDATVFELATDSGGGAS